MSLLRSDTISSPCSGTRQFVSASRSRLRALDAGLMAPTNTLSALLIRALWADYVAGRAEEWECIGEFNAKIVRAGGENGEGQLGRDRQRRTFSEKDHWKELSRDRHLSLSACAELTSSTSSAGRLAYLCHEP